MMNLGEGWRAWMRTRPPVGVPIQIMRENWEQPSIMVVREPDFADLSYMNGQALMNIAGLYWRLTGIAKMAAGRERAEAAARASIEGCSRCIL